MTKTAKTACNELQLACSSPHKDLVYRALVFARDNQQRRLYFVAGIAGGPWNALNALANSHKTHGGSCFYCGKGVAKGQATIDHVEPICRGGKSEIQNLVIACKPCNASKGHQVIEFYNPQAGKEWLEAVLAQVTLRLNAINPASSPPPPSPDAAGGP